MKNYYIKKIIARGNNKTESMVELSPKLSVIYGASNTGKSYIIKIIEYLFGSSKLDISDKNGYDEFSMILAVSGMDLTISRKRNEKDIIVESEIPYIESGIYSSDISGRNPINNLYLKLLGISDNFIVPSTTYCEMKKFSMKILLSIFILAEQEIELSQSVLLPKNGATDSYILSHLLYIIYKTDFSTYNAQDSAKIAKAKTIAVREYIQTNLEKIQKRIAELQEKWAVINNHGDIENEIQQISLQLSNIKSALENCIEKSKELLDQISALSENIVQLDILLNRYEALKTQYLSDIKRLSFIIESKTILGNNTSECTCPFCNSSFHEDSLSNEDVMALQGEITKITIRLNGLMNVQEELLLDKNNKLQELTRLKSEKSKLENIITNELPKQQIELERKVNEFKEFIKLHSEQQIIEDMLSEWNQDLTSYEYKPQRREYYPKQLFDKKFESELSAIIQNILKSCNYPKYETANFSLKSLDIEIAGHPKSTNGKGYIAFFNTVLILSIRKYLYDRAKIKPPFFIIDTPLLGLDTGHLENAIDSSLRHGIYNYFVSSMEQTQLIIIDNEKEMPVGFNLKIDGIHTEYFTHNESEGRYGFFLDYKD